MSDDDKPAEQPQAPATPPESPDYVPPNPTGEIDANWHGPRPLTEVPLPLRKDQADKKE